jgi:hypothetical protein
MALKLVMTFKEPEMGKWDRELVIGDGADTSRLAIVGLTRLGMEQIPQDLQ